jgi:hypothetical protein
MGEIIWTMPDIGHVIGMRVEEVQLASDVAQLIVEATGRHEEDRIHLAEWRTVLRNMHVSGAEICTRTHAEFIA